MVTPVVQDKKTEFFSHLSQDEVLKHFKTSEKGLTKAEAKRRLKVYGQNIIDSTPKTHVIVQFLLNFKNPLVIILLVIALISTFIGEVIDAVLVTLMVVLSVVLNFVQEYKADKAAEKLKQKLANIVIVLRDNVKEELNTSDLCIGDIIELNAGDLIPAECRVIETNNFFVNQAVLTGESFPAEKHPEKISTANPDLAQMTNILFHGTSVTTGSALAVVIKTGHNTEFGQISVSLSKEENINEFTKGINEFGVTIAKIIVYFVIFIFLVNSIIRHDFMESLLFSIAVAVGLTPEFLPMIMSVTMAKGSLRMAKDGIIVKKLSAIPTFGSMDILCTDKTGTLTQDKIQLVKYNDLEGNHSDLVLLSAYLNSYHQTGITNPMDKAILDFKKIGITGYKKVDEIPFDFNRKKMSVILSTADKTHVLITKGAPEEVFSSCKYYFINNKTHKMSGDKSKELIKQYLELSNDGYRVIAIASKEIDKVDKKFGVKDESDLVLLGYIAFLDPAKKDAYDAIETLEQMGIEMKIITGDNELVSKKICSDVGIKIKGVIQGHEFSKLSFAEIKKVVNEITIFARFSPSEKETVIKALRANGHVVGYMGDGINDSPSLTQADVGISVSNAVDVAKESAAIVLTRKSLHMLKDGVIEGRKTFGNTLKYIMMGISSNFGNMFSVLGAVLFLPFLPMLPLQILLNNFLYDLSQLTIPTDNVDKDFIKKPKRWSMTFIKKFMFVFGPISSFFDYLSFVVLFLLFKNLPGSFQTGWFMESLATQTLVIHVIRTRKIPFLQSRPSKWLAVSTSLITFIGWIIPYTSLGKFFGFTPLPLYVLGIIASIVLAYLLTVELGKQIFFKKYFDLTSQ